MSMMIGEIQAQPSYLNVHVSEFADPGIILSSQEERYDGILKVI